MNFFVLALTLIVPSAHATSLHPCTPTVRAQPTLVSCVDGKIYYSIKIETLMSRPNCDSVGSYYEYKTAYVETTNRDGKPLRKKLVISQEDFELGLTQPDSRATSPYVFRSLKFGIDPKECAFPEHGGVSFGN